MALRPEIIGPLPNLFRMPSYDLLIDCCMLFIGITSDRKSALRDNQ